VRVGRQPLRGGDRQGGALDLDAEVVGPLAGELTDHAGQLVVLQPDRPAPHSDGQVGDVGGLDRSGGRHWAHPFTRRVRPRPAWLSRESWNGKPGGNGGGVGGACAAGPRWPQSENPPNAPCMALSTVSLMKASKPCRLRPRPRPSSRSTSCSSHVLVETPSASARSSTLFLTDAGRRRVTRTCSSSSSDGV